MNKPLTFLFFLISMVCLGQREKFESKLTNTDKSFRINYCGENNSISIDISKNNIKSIENESIEPNLDTNNNDHLFFDNGKIIKTSLIPFLKVFNKEYDVKRQKVILTNYMNYELNYYSKSLIDSRIRYIFEEINGSIYLILKLKISNKDEHVDSKYEKNFINQVFLYRLCFDHIIVLNMALTKSQSKTLAIRDLKDIAKSINIYKTPCPVE